MHFYVTRNAKLLYLNPSFWLRKLASLQNYRMKSRRHERSLSLSSERVLVGSGVSNPGNMFSIEDSRRASSVRNSMVRVAEEQDSEFSTEKKRCFCFPKCFVNCKQNRIPQEIRRKGSKVDGAESDDETGIEMRQHHYYGSAKDARSHVGAAMQQLTGQRVALGVFVVCK
jgi:hypothetical protein